jgi:acetyl-CoA C-acetyltransferase
MPEHSTPVLVGCGEVTDLTTPVEAGRSPFDLIAQAGRLALADTEAPGVAAAIDTVAMLRLFSDTSHRFATRLGNSTNPPASVARRLGINAGRLIYTWNGGNMPQFLVDQFAAAIASGEMRAAIIAGGEALRTQHGVERAGLGVSWREDPGGTPELVGDPRRGWSEDEDRHHASAAIAFYPLIENAIRAARGRSMADHMRAMAKLLSAFAAVAAKDPLATRREGYSAERIATVNADNRWIGFPYPRLMNANAFIDQAAALIITSVETAQSLRIPQSKWVYLHGCADGHDHWYVSERIALDASPAIRRGARFALEMAGRALQDIDFFDLYSCFPSAVEVACQEIGLAEDDARGLTLTGGLPYFGGPGNNYVTHAISHMMRRLRAAPGAYGLVTATGNYLTKHAFGVYSTIPVEGRWMRCDPATLQTELDALPKALLASAPSGPAIIETYTLMHGRAGPEHGIIFGRLLETGQRFVANTPSEPAVLWDLQGRDSLGRSGRVHQHEGRNVFIPD